MQAEADTFCAMAQDSNMPAENKKTPATKHEPKLCTGTDIVRATAQKPKLPIMKLSTELHEKILAILPECEILRNQVVSRRFLDVIKGSGKLKLRLFMKQDEQNNDPKPSLRLNHLVLRTTQRPGEWSRHDFFNALLPALGYRDAGAEPELVLHAGQPFEPQRRRIPILLKLKVCGMQRRHPLYPNQVWPLVLSFDYQATNDKDRARYTGFLTPMNSVGKSLQESWREMHLCDPSRPIVWEVRDKRQTAMEPQYVAHGMLDSGVTLGDLVEKGKELGW